MRYHRQACARVQSLHSQHGLIVAEEAELAELAELAKEMSSRRPYGTQECILGSRSPHAKARG
jgi:hypothetical protein